MRRGTFIDLVIVELVLKLIMMTPRSVIQFLYWLVSKFLKFQLTEILWTAATNTYRRPENLFFYLKLFLYEISLVLLKFIMF